MNKLGKAIRRIIDPVLGHFYIRQRDGDVDFLWPEILSDHHDREEAADEFFDRVRFKRAWRGWSRERVERRLQTGLDA